MVIGGNNGVFLREPKLLFRPNLFFFIYSKALHCDNHVSHSHVSAHVYDIYNNYLQTMSKGVRDRPGGRGQLFVGIGAEVFIMQFLLFAWRT